MTLQSPHKWVIGLTGVMLSGKSTALAAFAQYGAAVFSADETVAQLYTKPAVQARLKRKFGTPDKNELARIVFKDEQKRKTLEKIIHPLVLKALRRQIKAAPQALAVCEIPLLFEAGWDKYVDMTLAVSADKKTLPARLKERGVTRAEYARRLKSQCSEAQKCLRADMVFFHRTKDDLRLKVKRLCQAFDLLDNRSKNGR